MRRVLYCALWLLVGLLVLAAWWISAEASNDCPAGADEWDYVGCDDGNTIDGFWWWGIWTPGLPRVRSQFMQLPLVMEGRGVWYSPQVMRATAEVRGLSLFGYLDGVASMSCADIGLPMWANRGCGWEGPYLVVDCPQLDDIYGVVVGREEVIEFGWDTAMRWTAGEEPPQGGWQVTVSRVPPQQTRHILPVRLRQWFLERVEFYPRAESVTLDPKPIYRSPSTWRLYGRWRTFTVPEWDWPSEERFLR